MQEQQQLDFEILVKQNKDKKILIEQLCLASDKVNKYNLFLLEKLEKYANRDESNRELHVQKNDQLKKLDQLDKLQLQYIEKFKQNEQEFEKFNKSLMEVDYEKQLVTDNEIIDKFEAKMNQMIGQEQQKYQQQIDQNQIRQQKYEETIQQVKQQQIQIQNDKMRFDQWLQQYQQQQKQQQQHKEQVQQQIKEMVEQSDQNRQDTEQFDTRLYEIQKQLNKNQQIFQKNKELVDRHSQNYKQIKIDQLGENFKYECEYFQIEKTEDFKSKGMNQQFEELRRQQKKYKKMVDQYLLFPILNVHFQSGQQNRLQTGDEVSDQDTIKVRRQSAQHKQIQFQIQGSQKIVDDYQSVDLQDPDCREEINDQCLLDDGQKNKKSLDLKQSLAKVKANQNFFGNSSVQNMLKSSLKENMIQSIDNKQFFQKYRDRKKCLQSSLIQLEQSEHKVQQNQFQKQSVEDISQYLNNKQQEQLENITSNIKVLNGLMSDQQACQNQDYQQYMDYQLIYDLNLFNQQLLNCFFGIKEIALSYQNVQIQLFKYHFSQKQLQYMDINECILLGRLYLVNYEYEQFDKLVSHIGQIAQRDAEYRSENEQSIEAICDILQGWKYLLYHQQANMISKKIYLSKAQKHFENIQVMDDIVIEEGFEASLFLGAILVEFNNMFSNIDRTIEYGEQLLSNEHSDTDVLIQILLNVILLNQKNNDEQYAGMINIIEQIKQLDDNVIFLMNLMFNYFKKSKFQDKDSYVQMIQIGMGRIDIFNDIDLEILKTLNLKYLYSQEPFDLDEFFQEYQEQDSKYPVYQIYQNYYLIKFLTKNKMLNNNMDLTMRSIKNLNQYLYLVKDPRSIIKIHTAISKVYDQFQLQNFNYDRLQNVVSGMTVNRSQPYFKQYQNLVQKQKLIQQQKDMLHQIYFQQQYQNLELVQLQQQLFKLINHCFSFSSQDDDQLFFPNIANQMMNQLQSLSEFRADILIAIFILLQYFVRNFMSKSFHTQNQNLMNDQIMITYIIEQNYKQIVKIYNSQLSLDLQKMGSMLYSCINIIDNQRVEEIIAYLYYKCLKKQQKSTNYILMQMKALFYEDIKNSFYLNYILLKKEFKQSNCLDEDYKFQYYEDISQFIQKFKFMKKIAKQIVKQKQDFYLQNQDIYNKIYYFYREVEL